MKQDIILRKLNENLSLEKSETHATSFDDSKIKYSWNCSNGLYFPTKVPNKIQIDPGLYNVKASMEMGLFLEPQDTVLDDIFLVPDETINIVLNDFEKFINNKETYKRYGLTHKRGVLMHGLHGCGKSTLINIITTKIVQDFGGIAVNVENLESFIPMMKMFRKIQPDTPILAIIEDMDSFLNYNSTKDFLNLLDGNLQINNILYLGTTNYLDRIEPRVKYRPSRFDLLIHIDAPNEKIRRYFLEQKILSEDLVKFGGSKFIDKAVEATTGFSFAHLKEFIISVIIMENGFEDTITRLRQTLVID
jgi:transitional endoplasmic reticulum ATPase